MSENRRWSKVHPNDPGENSELVDCFHFSHWQEKTSPGLEESLPTKRHQCFAKMNKGTIIMISQVMYRNQVKYVSDPSNLTYFDMFLPWNQQIWGEKWSMDIYEGAFSIGLVDSRRNQLEGVKNLSKPTSKPTSKPLFGGITIHKSQLFSGEPCTGFHGFWPVLTYISSRTFGMLSAGHAWRPWRRPSCRFSLQVFVADEAKKMGGISPFGDGDSTDSMGYGFVGFHNKVMENKQNWCHRKKAGDLTIIFHGNNGGLYRVMGDL